MTAGTGPEPDVSVIMIFHDEERFLTEAVDSVLDQDGPSWELILVDDGSNDGSGPLARRIAERWPGRIHHLTHPGRANRGMSASRNLGIEHARGRWLTFLDADDVWLPGKLAAQLAVLEGHPGVEVLVSPAQWWRTWGPPADGAPTTSEADWVQVLGDEPGPVTVARPPTLLVRFLEDEWSSICDLVISRRLVIELGGYEPSFTAMFEDQVFHAKVFSRWPALVTADWWYRYRQHDGACTATAHRAGDHLLARRRFIDWLDDHLEDQHGGPGTDRSADDRPDHASLRRLVRRQRWRLHHPRLTRVGRAARRVTSLASELGG